MKKIKFIIVFVLLCLRYMLHAQEFYTLESLFNLAEQHSRQLQINRTSVASAKEQILSAKNNMLPNLTIETNVGYLGNGWLAERNFSNGEIVHNPHLMNSFAIKAEQVIYSGGILSGTLNIAKINKELTELNLQRQRQEIRFIIAGYWLDIFRLSNQAKVIQHNINLNDTMLHKVRVQVSEGTALPNDITRYELQQENLLIQQRKIEDRLHIINYQLVTLLQLPEQTLIFPDTNMLEIPNILSLNDWYQSSLNNNISLQQIEKMIQIKEEERKMTRSTMIPKLAVFAANHLDGPITIEVPVIDKNFNYWYAGIGLQYDLSSLYKSHRAVKSARLEVQCANEEQVLAKENINVAVHAAYTELCTAQAELEMWEKSVQLSHENYDMMVYRYSNGLSLLTDMLDAANTKLSAELSLVNAGITLQYNYYKLLYICSLL